jgi:hypothetical protein
VSDDDRGRLAPLVAEVLAQLQQRGEARRRHDGELISVAVNRLNAAGHARMKLGGKFRALVEERDIHGRIVPEFMGADDFSRWLGQERYWAGGTKPESIGGIYLRHADARSFRGIAFAPEGAPEGVYNLWRGFSVEPSDLPLEKAAPTFLDHLRVNIARGDERKAQYVLAWFADMIQRPASKPGIALVLRGAEGSGKTVVGEVVGHLLGAHYFLVDDQRYLLGQFNAHMAAALLLQCDEGFWAGDKRGEGRLKGLVTSRVQMVEYKGLDAIPMRNLVRLMVTSNESWIVPAGPEARRWAVFDVADHARNNRQYFGQLWAEMRAGGFEALLGHLQRFDLSTVDLAEVPQTGALHEQKLASMSPDMAWWVEVLNRETPTRHMADWPPDVDCDALYGDYIAHCERRGIRHRLAAQSLKAALRKVWPTTEIQTSRASRFVPVVDAAGRPVCDADGNPRTERKQFTIWGLPPLDECRRAFAKRFNLPAGYLAYEPEGDDGIDADSF